MLDFGLKPSLFLPFAFLLSYAIYTLFIRKNKTSLPDLPWLNERKNEWFPKARARWRNTIHYKEAIDEAYQNYSKNERSCIISTVDITLIILPASSAEWIISQPDHMLSAVEAQREGLQFDRTFPEPALSLNPTHLHTINTGLTRQLGNLTTDIVNELEVSIDESWGNDSSEWKSIPVFDNVMGIVSRVTNRIFVGLPLCRDKALLAAASGFAGAVPFASNLLRLFPTYLEPLAAALLTIPNKLYFRRFRRLVEPEIRRRLEDYDLRAVDLEKKASEPERNDFLQWHINHAKKTSDLPELGTERIAGRIMMLNFAAIHTTTFSMTNLLFDLISTDPQLRILEQLRQEAESVLAEDGGVWTKRGVQKLVKMDSALRESQRINSFLGLGLDRMVVATEGLTTPQGVHCPRGSMIGVPAYGIHNDPNIFPDPEQFKPFRFAELRDDIDQTNQVGGLIKKAGLGFVTTSAEYLPFGHGRHACPGRFFAANELKLMLACMLLNYDIELQETRPPSKWLGTALLPPMKASIKVRRRRRGGKA